MLQIYDMEHYADSCIRTQKRVDSESRVKSEYPARDESIQNLTKTINIK